MLSFKVVFIIINKISNSEESMFSFQIRNKNSKRTCPSKFEVTLLYDTIILA